MTSSAAPLKPRPEPNRVPGGARGQPQTHRAPCVSVLIVDDSLTVRTALKRMVESDPMLIVTGTASSAETALAQIRQSAPDVVLLDLEMPGMGGLKALPAILELAPQSAVLVVSALTEEGAQATLAALAMGAADTMLKPRPGEFTEDYRSALVTRIRALGRGEPALAGEAVHLPLQPAKALPASPPPMAAVPLGRPDIIAIGASTGGIHALGQLLGQWPASFAVPILITQHLPASFMTVFARQIETMCNRPARLADNGLVITPGSITLASGEGHLTLRQAGDQIVTEICTRPQPSGCRPSVDPMLGSVAAIYGSRALAIILSGMGSDGLAGARQLVASGGAVIAQDAASSAVWGMPGVVTRAGLARLVAPPQALGQAVLASLSSTPRKGRP